MENNTYTWSYNYSLFKHRDWIKPYCYIVGISVLLIELALFLANPHDFIRTLIEYLWVIGMIVALYGLSVIIALVWYRKGYVYDYVLKDGWLKIKRNYVPMSHEMVVNERIGSNVNLKTVSYLRLHKKTNSISIRGFLTLTTVYADEDQIDYIYQLIKQECVNL